MNEQTRNDIIQRHQAGQSIRSIARTLGVSRHAVKRTIDEVQRARQGKEAGTPRLPKSPLLDPFDETIRNLLERYPRITAVRMLEELRREGYQGKYTILRQRLRQLRARPDRKPVLRFETEPGRQAQMDWAVYTIDFTGEGRRRVNLFSYVLGYSRRQYLHFTDSQDFETTIREHVRAFEHLGGVAGECLYDNMKTVVDRIEDDEPVYNARFLSFATHYGFRPRACKVRRPQTKGKVERPFYYVETNLLNGRTFTSLDHLNETTAWWLEHVADVRVHRETKETPRARHEEELPHLLPLPEHAYDTARVVYRVVNVEGLVSYQNNGYSVPWRLIGQTLPLRITEDGLIAYDGPLNEVARHRLLPPGRRGEQVVETSHRPADNRREQLEQLRQRFEELGDIARRFFEGLVESQSQVRNQAKKTLALLSLYHRRDVLAAMERAVRYRAFSWKSLERILAVRARPKTGAESLSDSFPPPLLLDDDPVAPRSTDEYQHLLLDETDHAEEEANPQDTSPPTDHDAPKEGDTEKDDTQDDPPHDSGRTA
jgi:transposase